MNTIATRFSDAEQPLTAVVQGASADAWTEPSPCEGWTALDVLKHLIDTQRDFFAARDVDLGAVPDVDADPAAAWREHANRVAEAVSDETLLATSYDGYFGPTTVGATLEQFYIWDMVVHRWDIARAVGGDTTFTDAELDWVEESADKAGDALTTEGICKPPVETAPDADRSTRVLARLGRTA